SPKTCQQPRQSRRELKQASEGRLAMEWCASAFPFHFAFPDRRKKAFMATAARANADALIPEFPLAGSGSQMQVRKRNGSLEPADVSKIVRAVERCSVGLRYVDAIRVASKTIGGLYNGATTKELDLLSIQTAASLIAEEPEYSKLAARL